MELLHAVNMKILVITLEKLHILHKHIWEKEKTNLVIKNKTHSTVFSKSQVKLYASKFRSCELISV